MIRWTCPICDLSLGMQAEHFPIHCRCGYSETLADFHAREANPSEWQPPPKPTPQPSSGIGDRLKATFSRLGALGHTGCRCPEWVARLNRMTPDEAEAALPALLADIQAELTRRGWLATAAAAFAAAPLEALRLASAGSVLGGVEVLVREAISEARAAIFQQLEESK